MGGSTPWYQPKLDVTSGFSGARRVGLRKSNRPDGVGLPGLLTGRERNVQERAGRWAQIPVCIGFSPASWPLH